MTIWVCPTPTSTQNALSIKYRQLTRRSRRGPTLPWTACADLHSRHSRPSDTEVKQTITKGPPTAIARTPRPTTPRQSNITQKSPRPTSQTTTIPRKWSNAEMRRKRRRARVRRSRRRLPAARCLAVSTARRSSPRWARVQTRRKKRRSTRRSLASSTTPSRCSRELKGQSRTHRIANPTKIHSAARDRVIWYSKRTKTKTRSRLCRPTRST